MGKPAKEDKTKGSDMKIFFKRSMNTNFSNSTCCTGAAELVTRSGYLQITKHLQNRNNYSEGADLKRDLSIETDACILRRYYKIYRHKISNQGSSCVSKRSTVVETEVDTIEEYPDTSACGDNEIMEAKSNHQIDIEALLVDNLKSLLEKWIKKKLLYNKNTQNKLDGVLDSILHKLDNKNIHEASSESTYVIHKAEQKQTVKNKKIATSSFAYQYCKSCRNKIQTSSTISRMGSSTVTIPCNYKGIRIISTLSVPRIMHKPRLCQQKSSSAYKHKNIKRKNVILSIDKSKELRSNSSFDFIAISKKSLTKRCANCDTMKKKRHIVLLPQPIYKESSKSIILTKQENHKVAKFEVNKTQLDDMPSLLKSLYTTSIDKNVQFDTKNDNCTMTDEVSEKNVGLSIAKNMTQSNVSQEKIKENTKYAKQEKSQYDICIKNDKKVQLSYPTNSTDTRTTFANSDKKATQKRKLYKRKRHAIGHVLTHYIKSNNVNNKRFTCLYRKAINPLQGPEFLKCCRNVFQYFTEHDSNRNISVDVRINVFPMLEPRTKDVCTNVSNQAIGTYDLISSPTLHFDDDNVGSTSVESEIYVQPTTVLDVEYERDPTISSSQCTAEIIPILDGAVSQAQYIFDVNSREKTEVKSDVATAEAMTNQLGILQGINGLRAVIKELAMTAEKFVSEQIKKTTDKINAETHFSLNMSDNYTNSSRTEAIINQKNPSKTTQVSTDLEKYQARSDIVNETKNKDIFDYYNRLIKKSTSYRIIDSESLLKVTDMTSNANKVNEFSCKFTDEALTCSLPKSRSLFEMTNDRNKKLIAFFCDNCVNPNVNCAMCQNSHSVLSPSKSSRTSTKSKKWRFWSKKAHSCTYASIPTPQPIPCHDGGYSSTISCQSLNSITEEENELVNKQERRGMGYGEGCVYCMLLWIPVVIILIAFYSCIALGTSEKKVASRVLKNTNATSLRNSSMFYLKLSDLGF